MIIGLTGFAGSGKDTVGAELVRRGWKRLSFADRLKQFAYNIDPIVSFEDGGIFSRLSGEVEVKGWERAKWEVYDVRRLLQAVGSSARAIFGENFWVDLAAEEIQKWIELGLDVVVTDVRYPNEAMTIRAFEDGFVAYVERPGVGPVNDHASDQRLPEELIDYYFSNEGGLDDIPDRVGAMLESLTLTSKTRKGLATIQEQIQEWMNRR